MAARALGSRTRGLVLSLVWLIAAACSGRPAPPPPSPKPTMPVPSVALTSPGPLASVHEALDQSGHCNACHVDQSPDLVDQKCIACHDHAPLGARIATGRGFHASPLVKGKPCQVCHRDHKGRRFDLTGWQSVKGGMTGFDHDLSGWPLRGKHVPASCDDCHKAVDRQGLRVFAGADKQCGACHQAMQPHGSVAKPLLACARCHTESAWKPPKSDLQFDHNDRKDAAFPLDGQHANTPCVKCHPATLFKLPVPNAPNAPNTAGTCANCHAAQSKHGTHLFGARPCDWCHAVDPTWKRVVFGHTERTRFDLGKHRLAIENKKLDCYSCHPTSAGATLPKLDCVRCHAALSKHANRFDAYGKPPACESCHPTTSWKPSRFDHRKTKFPLTFRHASITCRECHRGKLPKDFEVLGGTQSTCVGCHAHAKVHDGKYKNNQCLDCHVAPGATGIRGPTPFIPAPHRPTGKFPLLHRHAAVACLDCHKAQDAAGKPLFVGLASECSACHQDSHQGKNGAACSKCHVSGTWKTSGGPPSP